MLIGVPKELKSHEYRVGLVPGAVRELVHRGHKVVVETSAGAGIGFDDAVYEAAGAAILARPGEVFATAPVSSEAEVDAEVGRYAESVKKSKESVRARMEKDGDIAALSARIREEKTLDLLKANARLDLA